MIDPQLQGIRWLRRHEEVATEASGRSLHILQMGEVRTTLSCTCDRLSVACVFVWSRPNDSGAVQLFQSRLMLPKQAKAASTSKAKTTSIFNGAISTLHVDLHFHGPQVMYAPPT